jgi:hypothetical protein
VGPQQISQRLAPTVRLAEQVEKLRLFLATIVAARNLDLDLRAEDDRVDCFFGAGVGHAQLE